MIPKIIHYCWFGKGPKPDLAIKCIESWKRFLPEYEIKEWNESNFNVNIIPYTAEAYQRKDYAFVSDYARFWILYKYGGLYFDTDVEVIKNMDEIISVGAFMGCEFVPEYGDKEPYIASGLGLGVCAGNSLYKQILDTYNNMYYISKRGLMSETVVRIVTRIIKKNASALDFNYICKIKDITIYPKEYFCPKNYFTGELEITENTYTIHHYAASWITPIKEQSKTQKRIEQLGSVIKHYCFILTYNMKRLLKKF